MDSVGVCTRPTVATEPPRRPYIRVVSARVPLMPISQSDSERHCAASCKASMDAAARGCSNASRIASFVIDDHHSRWKGFLHPARR